MRKRSTLEPKRATTPINVLIAQTEHNLSQVGLRSLRLGDNHLINIILPGRHLLRNNFLHITQSIIEFHIDLDLKRISNPIAPLMQILLSNIPYISIFIEGIVIQLLDIQDLCLSPALQLLIDDDVLRSHREGACHQPVVSNTLGVCDELACLLGT